MGTNYYLMSKNRESVKKNFGEYPCVDEYTIVDEPYLGYEIHVSKISCGWCPLFQLHNRYKTFEQFEKFYKENKDDYEIYDEYLQKYSFEEFKNKMIDHSNREPEPVKWVYKHNDLFDYDGKKSLYIEDCEPDEADIWVPFNHQEYQESYNSAVKKYNHHVPFSIGFDDIKYYRDPDYKFDWTKGDFG